MAMNTKCELTPYVRLSPHRIICRVHWTSRSHSLQRVKFVSEILSNALTQQLRQIGIALQMRPLVRGLCSKGSDLFEVYSP